MPRWRRVVSRIAYGLIYLWFLVLLGALLLFTPGDIIALSLHHHQIYNVWIVIVAFVVTVIIVCVVYVMRIYVNKTALASIPKAWLPIEKGDVEDAVCKMIAADQDRSAIIAYEAHPRVEMADREPQLNDPSSAPTMPWRLGPGATQMTAEALGIVLLPNHAVWGEFEHGGWASPYSPDMPGLQYRTVVSELPHLIEGKALALAPSAAPPDPDAAALLQRSPGMDLRAYMSHLTRLGVVTAGKTTTDFVSRYERARFSARPVVNGQFRDLMHLFAQVLRAMRPPEAGALKRFLVDSTTPTTTTTTTPTTDHDADDSSGSGPVPTSQGQDSPLDAAPRTPMQPSPRRPTRQPGPTGSSGSVSEASSSEYGSVIRLATNEGIDALPYILYLANSHGWGEQT
ncbi:hypothetical protein CDD80_2593 [Ophiocordyceps camponoti-rufipedis]|uniref:Defect at low temperature protein 1 n=1 Tax=Ophiocordyceps camponoti-rufipedis TaxID=2004952 RepID=A0A2C5Z7M6_9HYPO|nr:hypothetical protein CDD80_2593 [Ophiocordyceps camponoti-rufipedis]